MSKTSKIHIHKMYTKAGDDGTTGIIGTKERVSKASLQVEAYGSCDELIAHIGLAASLIKESQPAFSQAQKLEQITDWLTSIQNHLFDLGSLLATAPSAKNKKEKIFPADKVVFLEQVIDDLEPHLPPLDSFVLPGGSVLNAQLHLCRTVCRRVERAMVRLKEGEAAGSNIVPEVLMHYINRLSDVLFALARTVSFELREKEVLWVPGK